MSRDHRTTSTSKAADATIRQVRALASRGLVQAARDMALAAVKRTGGSPELLFQLATLEEQNGDFSAAAQHIEMCLQAVPNHLDAHALFGRILLRQGRSGEAIDACNRGLVLRPGYLPLITFKATAQDYENDCESAWETLAPVIASDDVSSEAAGLASRVLYGLGRHDDAILWAKRAAVDTRSSPEARRTVWLHLVKVLDKVGRFDEAMSACHEAHATVKRTFQPLEYERHVHALMAMFSKRSMRMLSRSTNQSEVPVFVIGMPRSGTTLVEQVIAAHPLAFGAGEINDTAQIARTITAEAQSIHTFPDCLADVTPDLANRLSATYVRHLQDLGGCAQRVTNKMLEQYEYVGLIWMLLPRARIIHVRRDPRDTCLSCYTRHLNPERMAYATNLEHLGFVYRQHERLMEHWKTTLDLRFLTVQYEEMVADQVRVTRQIIDFLGLPWDDRCLRYWEADRTVMTLSYDQVNKPIYDSSIGRWKNYEKHLGPLKKALDMTGETAST